MTSTILESVDIDARWKHSPQLFESWTGLQNLRTVLVYTGGTLRSKWCSQPCFCCSVEKFSSLVFSPSSILFKEKKPRWYYYGSATVVFAMTLTAIAVFLEWSQKVSKFSNIKNTYYLSVIYPAVIIPGFCITFLDPYHISTTTAY